MLWKGKKTMNEMWLLTWKDVELWRWLLAFVSGVGVGMIYFESLKWSISKLGNCKHRISLFAGVALCRILLFLGVMVLIANHNIAVVIVYVVSFFITKMIFITLTKKAFDDDLHKRSDDKC